MFSVFVIAHGLYLRMLLCRAVRLIKHKNPNLYHSYGFYEGLADGTTTLGQNTCKNENPDKIKDAKERHHFHKLKNSLLS